MFSNVAPIQPQSPSAVFSSDPDAVTHELSEAINVMDKRRLVAGLEAATVMGLENETVKTVRFSI